MSGAQYTTEDIPAKMAKKKFIVNIYLYKLWKITGKVLIIDKKCVLQEDIKSYEFLCTWQH